MQAYQVDYLRYGTKSTPSSCRSNIHSSNGNTLDNGGTEPSANPGDSRSNTNNNTTGNIANGIGIIANPGATRMGGFNFGVR
jgi:hypothetical protein